nr:MAG TPA: hypothetical protein [Caudoviricetes sp.]
MVITTYIVCIKLSHSIKNHISILSRNKLRTFIFFNIKNFFKWFLRKDKYQQRFSLFKIKYVCNAHNSYAILLIFIRLGLILSAHIKTDYLVTLVCISICFL